MIMVFGLSALLTIAALSDGTHIGTYVLGIFVGVLISEWVNALSKSDRS